MSCYPGQPLEDEAETFMDDLPRKRTNLRPHSTHTTIKWLEQNYHLEDGVCLPRSTIYEHYIDFCERDLIQAVNAASFGKIIRQQFPTLTTRRLGTRGQSKYHYYGLGIKQTSRYYTPDYVDRISQGNSKKTQETRKTNHSDKPSAVLPSFPDLNTLNLPDLFPIDRDKLKTFIVMYRAHCQRILDSVVRANFTEIESFFLHFWQGMPTHMVPVLGNDLVVDLVAHCDTLLYKVITNVLIISPLQNLPESLIGEIRTFSEKLKQWMELALKGLPESLQEAKYKVAEGFINGLKRQTALTKLAQVARAELRNGTSLDMLKQDWESVDFNAICAQALYAIDSLNVPKQYHQLLPHFLERFNALLNEQTELENFVAWADDMVHSAVVKASEEDQCSLKDTCQAFMLAWKFITSKILQEFTMENAPSFGFFIIFHMLLDDYIAHLVETRLEKDEEQVYVKRIELLKKGGGSPPVMQESSTDSSPSDSDPTLLPLHVHSPNILNDAAHNRDSSLEEVDEPDLPTFVSNISFPPLSLTSSASTSPPPEPVNLSSPTSLNLPKSITNNSLSLSSFPPQLHANHTTKNPNRLQQQNSFSNTTIFPNVHSLQQSPVPIGVSKPQTTQSQTSQLSFPSQASIQSPPQLPQQQLHTLIPSLQTSQPLPQPVAGHSMLSSAPVSSYGTITTQPHMLGSTSILNQTFTSQSHQQPLGQRQPVHQQILTQPQQHSNQINTDLNTGTSRLPPSIPALNVPFTPSSSTVTTQSAITNSGNFSIFPTMQGVYPYTPFVGIPTVPAQMNTHFTPTGIQMPTATNRPNTMPGYSYLPGMSPSLYNTQVTTNSFTRN